MQGRSGIRWFILGVPSWVGLRLVDGLYDINYEISRLHMYI